jgi:hypothetical protein
MATVPFTHMVDPEQNYAAGVVDTGLYPHLLSFAHFPA